MNEEMKEYRIFFIDQVYLDTHKEFVTGAQDVQHKYMYVPHQWQL